jgi:hypothetical protein
MVTATSAVRLAFLRWNSKHAGLARPSAKARVTTVGRPPRQQSNMAALPTRLAAIRVRATGRASGALGDPTNTTAIRHHPRAGSGKRADRQAMTLTAATHFAM